MIKDRDESLETWEADAQASFAVAAESEFTRLKTDLKRKAGLLAVPPLHLRVVRWFKAFLVRLMGFL